MAFLDDSIKQLIGNDDVYYNLLAKMTLKEAKEFRYVDNRGKECKLKQKEALKRVNRMLAKKQRPTLSLSWVKKHWKLN